MKRLSLLFCSLLLVTACSKAATSSDTIRYTLKIDATDAAKRTELTQAAKKVAERVVESMEKKIVADSIDTSSTDPVLQIKLDDPKAIATLTDILTSPFKLRVMAEHDDTKTADITVQGTGKQLGFSETGITEKSLDWVTASPIAGDTKAEVRLDFTPAGRDQLSQVFKDNKGKTLGIFVRNKLISVMQVESDKPMDVISISGIPSLEIATIFADDVNRGLHVQYVPVTK